MLFRLGSVSSQPSHVTENFTVHSIFALLFLLPRTPLLSAFTSSSQLPASSLTPPPLLSLSSPRAELQRRGRTAAPAGQAPAARLSLAPAERAAVVLSLPPMAARSHPPSLPGALPACVSSAPSLLTARSPAMAARPALPSPPRAIPLPVGRPRAVHDRTVHGEAGAQTRQWPVRGHGGGRRAPHRNPAAS